MRTDYDSRRERQTKRLALVVRWVGEYQLTNGDRPKNYSVTFDAARTMAYFSARGLVWSVWDNGGEYGLEQVNMSEPVFFPVPDYLDAATIAYRVACVVRGDEIDYKQDMSDCELPGLPYTVEV